MRYLAIILILIGAALAATSCCPVYPAYAPVVVTQPIPAAVPVLPTYGPYRCHPGYMGYCAPHHLPYVTRPMYVNPVLAPYAHCNPCY